MEMIDFDFLIDENFEIVKTVERFSLHKGVYNLNGFEIPTDGESIRFISGKNGFSSCCLILKIAEQSEIRRLIATTLRVGKKEICALEKLEIPKVTIICGLVSKNVKNKYQYSEFLEEKVKENGWRLVYSHNHSKVILLETSNGFLTIETSSNLNENPQIEQFCVMNSREVFDYYLSQFERLGLLNEQN